ncbi:DMT family transporter [Sediminibacterium sp.]|uniref:DMT family transporter n=1 Tax=Sediminibacterium sp. TaxID=1917865 RepID=UPI0025EABC4C|nr:DMT family transporter [Sediminibacterium sp.]MBW0177531.1 DMT family transporter [Sediminibacterium sp.]
MRDKIINWGIFILLSIIWGSSFILMKEGMHVLTPYQVASIRILSAGLILTPFALKALKQIPQNKWLLVILSGLLGNFFPAYLFCIAETEIDSSLAGILNALTPMFTILVGISFFQLKANSTKILGVIIGFIGLCLLMLSGKEVSFNNLSYAGLVLLATLCYGINVNMVGRYMKEVGSLNIASLAFVFLIIPSAIILYFTGYLELELTNTSVLKATSASFILGVLGTAFASIIFYMLVKRAGTLFASMVTYGIPFIAVFWGLLDGEKITLLQIGCLGVILCGVYLVNKKNS